MAANFSGKTMAEAFEKGGQRAWFHDHGHWGGFFHTYDNLQLSGFGAHFDQPRKIHVFIPRDYEVSGDHYPVLYCNDGDDIFFPDGESGQSWQVAELLSRMYLREQLPKMIVVAICAGDRPYEYSHIPDNGGGLEDYGRYLAKGLKPFIDGNYRTLADAANRGTIGMGPTAEPAVRMALLHPDTFGFSGVHSPWLFDYALPGVKQAIAELGDQKPHIYVDIGAFDMRNSEENWDTRKYAKGFVELLKENGIPVTYKTFQDGTGVPSWRHRTVPMLMSLLPAKSE
jgi:enterochelin esterase-like enzyme